MTEDKKNEKLIDILFFVAVFFSATAGVSICGLSLSKVALVPLEIYLLFRYKGKTRINRTQRALLIWYLFGVLSGLNGYISDYAYKFDEFSSRTILFALQIIIVYIPIMMMIGTVTNPGQRFKDCIVITAKINSIWAIAQVVLWNINKFDLNKFFFNTILHGVLGKNWTGWNYEMGVLGLRVTGLNYDAAYLGLILVLGFVFCENYYWKGIFALAVIFSLSRTAIAGIIICFISERIFAHKRISSKDLRKFGLFLTVAIAFIVLVLLYLPAVQGQLKYALFRIRDVYSGGELISTSRHINYFAGAWKVWFYEFDIIRKLVGMGPRVGGVAFSISSENLNLHLSSQMYYQAWAVECDYAELLLGHGLLGYFIFYVLYLLFQSSDNYVKEVIVAYVFMALMYGYMDLTIMQLFILCFSASYLSKYDNNTD